MPWGDGTGPLWMASRASGVGRRNPWCIGGVWRVRRAYAPWYDDAPTLPPAEEMERLQEAARILELDLQNIRERIEALRSKR
jgi:hypothetical protein